MSKFDLFEVRPLSESLGLYVPAVVLQRARKPRAAALFHVAHGGRPVRPPGSGHDGLWPGRHAGHAGQFRRHFAVHQPIRGTGATRRFFCQGLAQVTLLAAAITVVLLALTPWVADLVIGTAAATNIGSSQRQAIFAAALVNGFLSALYLNLTAWMQGCGYIAC